MDSDLIVVGGGPAGAAAAFWAARAGLDVILVDKADFPRDKTCGDGLTASALRELAEMGIDVRSHARVVDEVEIVGPYAARVVVPLDAGLDDGAIMGAVVRRADLDSEVLETAAASGAKVLQGVGVDKLERHADHVAVHVDEPATQCLRSKFVIGADGAHSLVRRTLYPLEGRRLPGIHAVRQYVDAPESNRLSVYFPPDLLPGYGWIFPLPGGGANVGIGVPRDPELMGRVTREALTNDKGRIALGGLKARFREFLGRPDVIERIGVHSVAESETGENRMLAWPIPADPSLNSIGSERALLVGDAARVVDPMTGEGIGQALISARIAARNIAHAIAQDRADAAVGYRVDLDAALGRDLRFAAFLVRVIRHRRGAEWGYRVAGLTPWTRRNVARWLFEDYPRAQILTPRRWRRFSMRGRGAYGGS